MKRTIGHQKHLLARLDQPLKVLGQPRIRIDVFRQVFFHFAMHDGMRGADRVANVAEQNLRMVVDAGALEQLGHVAEQRHFGHRKQIGQLDHAAGAAVLFRGGGGAKTNQINNFIAV